MVYEIISIVLALSVVILIVICRIKVWRISLVFGENRELHDRIEFLETELRKKSRAEQEKSASEKNKE